jgi:hypothetical protein
MICDSFRRPCLDLREVDKASLATISGLSILKCACCDLSSHSLGVGQEHNNNIRNKVIELLVLSCIETRG